MMRPVLRAMMGAQERERQRIRNELGRAKGLMPVLMKPRNGNYWTREDRTLMLQEFHALAGLSPYLVPIVMPGGVLLLPLLAWWLDRRRDRRRADAAQDHRERWARTPAERPEESADTKQHLSR